MPVGPEQGEILLRSDGLRDAVLVYLVVVREVQRKPLTTAAAGSLGLVTGDGGGGDGVGGEREGGEGGGG